MTYNEVPKFPHCSYSVDHHLGYFETAINGYVQEHGLILNPDFQRGHVWTREQQEAYIEFLLKEPVSGRDFYFNHPGWMSGWNGDFVCVDGLQRITAILAFVRQEIKAYGQYEKEFGEGRMSTVHLRINIARLQTKKDVLKWYLDFNSARTVHSREEIERVKAMIAEQQ